MNFYRDSKGRIRNADKITPENQERLYRGEPLKIEPVKIDYSVKRKKNKKTGKIEYKTEIRYKKLNGKFASKIDYERFQYIRNLTNDSRKIFTTREVENFNVISEIAKALRRGNTVKFDSKLFTPDMYVNLVRKVRKNLEADSGSVTIFYIEEAENGNLRIISISDENDEIE